MSGGLDKEVRDKFVEGIKKNNKNMAPYVKDFLRNYYMLGFSVIPIKFKDKRPPLVQWTEYMERRPSWSEIEQWINEFKIFNIGIVTGKVSQLFVLDFDDKNTFWKWFNSLDLGFRLTLYNFTLKVFTNRGVHVYVRPKDLSQIPDTAIQVAEGLDIKGEKGYVLAPPSVREDNRKYFFFRGDVVKVKTHSLLPLSKKLVEDLMKELKKVG